MPLKLGDVEKVSVYYIQLRVYAEYLLIFLNTLFLKLSYITDVFYHYTTDDSVGTQLAHREEL